MRNSVQLNTRTQPRATKRPKAAPRSHLNQRQRKAAGEAAGNEASDSPLSRQDAVEGLSKQVTEEQVLKTREQIAARYQVSVRTVDYWREDGTLPFHKRGGIVRFHPAECDKAMKTFRQRSRWESSVDDEGNEAEPT